ncbi:MAG TPA: hypothetical protein VNL77_20430 [Roseiflexaceae bacterium]|nr:hypothetical protein [Roseiflexaceae bacterium]
MNVYQITGYVAPYHARPLKRRARLGKARLRGLYQAAQAAFVQDSPPVHGPGVVRR